MNGIGAPPRRRVPREKPKDPDQLAKPHIASGCHCAEGRTCHVHQIYIDPRMRELDLRYGVFREDGVRARNCLVIRMAAAAGRTPPAPIYDK